MNLDSKMPSKLSEDYFHLHGVYLYSCTLIKGSNGALEQAY